MMIKALKLCGIKAFPETRSVDLGDGVNLFYGANRAGKSSILEGMVVSLFGLPRSGVKRLNKELIFSWTKPDSFETEVAYRCEAGLFKIRRDFLKGGAAIYSWDGAEDLKLITQDKNIVAEKVAEHTGIDDISIFLSTCCIRQGDLELIVKNLKKVGQVVETILSGAEGVNALAVLEALKKKKGDLKPRDSRDIRPANPRDYERLSSEEVRLSTELDDIRQKRQRAEDARQELSSLDELIPRLEGRRAELAKLLEKHGEKSRLEQEINRLKEELKKESARIERIKELEEKISGLDQKLNSSGGRKGLGRDEAEELKEQSTRKKDLKKSIEEMLLEKTDIECRLQALYEEERNYKVAGRIETAKNDFRDWERNKGNAAEIIARKGADLEELKIERAAKISRAPSPAKVTASLCGAFAFFATLLALIVARLDGILWLASAGIVSLALLAWYFSLRARKKRFDASAEDVKIDISSQEIAQQKALLEGYEQKINSFLNDLGIRDGADLRRICDEYEAHGLELKKEKDRFEEAQRRIKQKSGDLNGVESKIDAILRRASCASAEDFFAKFREIENVNIKRENLQSGMRELLGGYKIEELKAQSRDKLIDLNSKETRLSSSDLRLFAPSAEEVERWEEELKELDSKIEKSKEKKSEREGMLQELDRDKSSPESWEERLSFVRARLGEIDKLSEACSRAIECLDRAIEEVRGEYLPELEKRVQAIFCSFAADEFTGVNLLGNQIEPILTSPTKPDITLDSLSAGTLDQLFLSLRFASLDVIGGSRRLPLILDDPLVNCDRKSKAAMLGMIADVAKSHQVVFFTCHEEFRDWAEALKKSSALDVMIFEIGPDHGIVVR